MQFCVIGLGKFGRSVANELYKLGNQVVGMDIDEKKVEQCSHFLHTSMILDATDKATLEELNIQDFDAVLVSIGEDLESNLICTINLMKLNAKEIWAKAKNSAHYTILQNLGIKHIVRPEKDMGILVGQAMNCPMVNHFIPLDSNLFLIHLIIASNANIKLKNLQERYTSVQVIAIQRGEELITQLPEDTEIYPLDRLLIIGELHKLRELTKELK